MTSRVLTHNLSLVDHIPIFAQGRDDMRMDERLMQVLRAANGMLAAAPAAARRRLAVRPFAITPLGPRLGLLQWVDDTVPLFHVRLT